MATIHGSREVLSVDECSAEKFDEVFLRVTKGMEIADGFFSYFHGDSRRYLLINDGQPFCAAKDRGDGGRATTLKEFFEPFLNDNWYLSFHAAEKALLDALAVSWQRRPDAYTSPGLLNPAAIVQALEDNRHHVVVRIRRGGESSFAVLREGQILYLYGPSTAKDSEAPGALRKLLADKPESLSVEIFRNPTVERASDWALIPPDFLEGTVRFYCLTAPHLVILLQDKELQRLPLTTERTTIGRDPTNDVVIDNLSVSRRHAMIVFSNGVCTIQDLGSSNGTLVGGKRIASPTQLPDGQEAIIGKHTVRFLSRALLRDKLADAAGMDKTVYVRVPEILGSGAAPLPTLTARGISAAIRKTPFTIGSTPECDLQIRGRGVKPKHAQVSRDAGGLLWVSHEGGMFSSTRINGQKVKLAPLQSGDLLKLGSVLLRFHHKHNPDSGP